MCGIVGIFDINNKSKIDQSILRRMNESQFHRGPDEGGIYVNDGIGLGHRRLSIIDLSNGKQPLFNEDHTVVVVYNGEIYNFNELRTILENNGHTFRTKSDTEVIVHAWEQWGENCVEHFRGMFAFAIWDSNKDYLFLARDRIGIKPLYYSLLSNGQLIFSSELKALITHPQFNKTLSPQAIDDYFSFGYIPDPKTIFKNAHKLSPGHTLLLYRHSKLPNPKCYWDIPFNEEAYSTEKDICEDLIDLLKEAIDMRLISDVPIGAFLSGGIDSSAVVALMSNLREEPIDTCSISFNNSNFDESIYSSRVAKRYKTIHSTHKIASDDNLELVDLISSVYDEPFSDNSALPTYRLCELARKKVKVALSGDGGDENFAGYETYKYHANKEKLRSLLPEQIRKPIFSTLGRIYPKLDWAPRIIRAKTTFETLAQDTISSFARSSMICAPLQRQSIYSKSFINDLQGYTPDEIFFFHANNAPSDNPISLAQYLDFKTYLPGDILTKVDRASMAHSLEVRVPLLDHKFVEWSSNLPQNLKLKKGEGKYILKKSLEPYLPNEILYRKKQGFDIPLSDWLKGPLRNRMQEILTNSNLAKSGLFDLNAIAKLNKEHLSGKYDHSSLLWAIIQFDNFLTTTYAS